MKFKNWLLSGTTALLMMNNPAIHAEEANLDAAQKKQFENLIHEYLINNPEVLLETSQVLQQRQQQKMQQDAQLAIQKNAQQILSDGLTTMGNPKGEVTLVEFFDYQCGHCKKMNNVMANLVKKNKNLRIIYKEFPIFGNESELASKVALAAAQQGKYKEMQNALLKYENSLSEQEIMNLAKKNGLNMAKLKQAIQNQDLANILNSNRELAERLKLMGTPAFILVSTPNGAKSYQGTPEFIPGAASEQTLQSLINKLQTSS